MNPQEATQLIRNRRSIYPRLYSGVPVPDEVIEEMLENANWAPTHRLTEPWRFVVHTGEGIKRLAAFQSELYKKVSNASGSFAQDQYDKLATKPMMASHIIAIGMKRDPKESLPEIEEVEAVAMAVQNMYLTATAHGVGCYWGSGGVTYIPEAAEYFGFDKLLGFMYCGMPKIAWPKGNRKPIVDKVRWER